MKRLVSLVLALFMLCTFAGCKDNPSLDPTTDMGSDEYSYYSDWEWEEEEDSDSGEDSESEKKEDSKSGTASKDKDSDKGSTSKDTGSKIVNTNIDLGVTVPKGEYDFGGKDLVVTVWTDYAPSLGESKSEDARYYAVHYAMQKYNIGSVEFKKIASGQVAYNQTFIKYAASGDFWGDIMNVHSDYVKAYIQQGLIQNLKSTSGKLNSKYFVTDCCNVGSGAYGFSAKGAITLREHFLIYNTDLLKKNNLEDPQKLYNQNKWTWDKYQEYVRTITDSNKDIKGMAIPNFHQLFNDPVYSADYIDSNGKYVCGWTDNSRSAKMDKLYNWIIEMYNEGSVFGDFIIGQEALDSSRDAFRNGKVGFLFADNSLCKTFKSEGLKNFKIVAGPTEDGSHKYYNSSAHYSFWGLPSTKSRYSAEQLMAVCNDLFTTTDSTHGKAYYAQSEDELAESLYADYYLSMADAKYAISVGKVTSSYYGWGIFVNESFQVAREMLQPVLQGDITWANAKKKYVSQRQSDLDKSLNSGLYK